MKLVEIAFSGFWEFIGMFILIYTFIFFIINGLVKMWSRFMRMLMVRKHGWPPSHLDADGDFMYKKKKKEIITGNE
jgi:hypothetical protein